MRSKMSDQLGALVGRRVGLRLYDGSRLDDCRLISLPGGRLVNTAIAWALANPAVQAAIVGARRPEHIEDSIAAAELRLSQSDLDQVDRIMSGAVPMSGPHSEMMHE